MRANPCPVLVVDDYPGYVEAIQLLLTLQGHEVRVARTCAEAVTAVDTFTPAVVLLDIDLPDGSGYELAARLRAKVNPAPALIAVTGRLYPLEQSLAVGFDHHFVKPVDPLLLAAALRRLAPGDPNRARS